jgi:hypothetical protein
MVKGSVKRFTYASTSLVLANRLMLIRMPLFELCGVVWRGILHATVRMMDKPRPWVASHQSHTQTFQDKSGFQSALQVPA